MAKGKSKRMRTEGCGDWECGKGQACLGQAGPSVSWPSCEAADESLTPAGIPQESRSLAGC